MLRLPAALSKARHARHRPFFAASPRHLLGPHLRGSRTIIGGFSRCSSTSAASDFHFFLNGKTVRVDQPQPETTLIDYLRTTERLTGTKLACGEGGCGACTVMVSQRQSDGRTVHRSMNSCLVPLCGVEGAHVTTPEGIGSSRTGDELHPAQSVLAEHFGSQCGYCTPGFVMSIFSKLAETGGNATHHQLEKACDGNLCRCTGYRSIAAAISDLSSDGGARGSHAADRDSKLLERIESLLLSHQPAPLHLKGDLCEWYRPVTLQGLLDVAREHPDAKVVVGNTEVGIERRFGGQHYPTVICPTHVPEMQRFGIEGDSLHIGAALPLTDVWEGLRSIDGVSSHAKQRFQALCDQLHWFSGTSVRNAACLGGNVCTASPISDVNPVLLALDATMVLASAAGGHRRVPAKQFFLPRYRGVDMRPGEVLIGVEVPLGSGEEHTRAYKVARRREDDIAVVTCGMRVAFDGDGDDATITSAHLAFGGMSTHTTSAARTQDFLLGKRWTPEVARAAIATLQSEMALPSGTPGGMEAYRGAVAASLLHRFFLAVADDRGVHHHWDDWEAESGGKDPLPHNPPLHGEVRYHTRDPHHGDGAVGRPTMHSASLRQCAGEAEYIDDVSPSQDELHAALVTSTHAHAVLGAIDASQALAHHPGVVAVLTHKDVPGSNITGDIVQDEEVLASERVTCVGQPIAVVLGRTPEDARAGAAAVHVEYHPEPHIMSIDQAEEHESFYEPQHGKVISNVSREALESAIGGAPRLVEGVVRMGGQEHFYFEPQTTVATPSDGEMVISSSTQNANKTQQHVAATLGLPSHKVSCVVRRIGGGFGGKETQSITPACIAALGAYHANAPVRLVMGRDEDMAWTGKRHPFKGTYRVGFDDGGRVLGAHVDVVSNGGNFLDLSWPVTERAMFHSDNAYRIPAMRVRGRVARTNTISNTAFRGFGGPQGMFVADTWMEEIARVLHKRPEEVRRANLYGAGDTTHFGMAVEDTLGPMWDHLVEHSRYHERLERATQANAANTWTKVGMAIVPAKFGIAFTATFLNQGSSLVHAYTDGSVLVTHGGVEMGQGLHTKVQQVAATALGLPIEKVHISHTATDKIPNASPTAASVGSDVYGMATLKACEELNARLSPYRENLGDGAPFSDVVQAAYMDRTSLSAQGYYRIPVTGFDFATGEGRPFNYFTSGVAASEVEVDTLTGNHRCIRTDVVMDMGKSLNPGIDVGQIEGAFVQGQGLSTIEELVWGDEDHPWVRPGHLRTTGPGAYKIPSMDDVPRQFNVTLMEGASNPRAVHSSRAVGEPPLYLGTSVYFACRDAIFAARQQNRPEAPPFFPTDSPLTAEKIRMACGDEYVVESGVDPDTYRPQGSW